MRDPILERRGQKTWRRSYLFRGSSVDLEASTERRNARSPLRGDMKFKRVRKRALKDGRESQNVHIQWAEHQKSQEGMHWRASKPVTASEISTRIRTFEQQEAIHATHDCLQRREKRCSYPKWSCRLSEHNSGSNLWE